MFTGLIQQIGRIQQISPFAFGHQVWVEANYKDLELGESIAVDGICLTVAEIKPNAFRCDLSPETLQVSVAQYWTVGKTLNLERALRASDRIGGHFVYGHVDQTAKLTARKQIDEYLELEFSGINKAGRPYLVEKGSIAINGVSLTLNTISDNRFSVMLIPHTLQLTNLNELIIDAAVNIEFDWLAKLVVAQLKLSREPA